jgi:hypothetical protein
VATVLIALARTGISWSGKPQQLYESIVKVTGHTLGPRWPKTISKFGSELRRIAPQLRLHGISIDFDRRGGDRVVTLKMEGATTGIPSTNPFLPRAFWRAVRVRATSRGFDERHARFL